jgi:uncharacterized protein (TIRG00374 family)
VWLGLVVSAVFAYLAVRGVRFAEMKDALGEADYWWIVPGTAALAAYVFIKAVRWRQLFAPEQRPPLGAVLRALLVGYLFNNILPMRAGEAARIVALKQAARTPRAETAATVVLERAYDVFSLLVLLFAVLPWFPHVGWLRAAGALAIVLTLGIAVAVALLARYGDRPVGFALRPLTRLRFLDAERVEVAVANLTRGLAGLRRPRLMFAAFAWTTAAWLTLALSCWLIMRGFDLDLSLAAGLLVVIATNLAAILPSSPAGVGVFEQATLVALGAYGISDSRALSYALVLHVVNFVPFLVVGVLVLQQEAVRARRVPSARS